MFTHRLTALFLIASTGLFAADRLGIWPELRPLTTALYGWLILLGAFALLLGIANVAWVHIQRIQTGQIDWLLSLVLVASFFVVFVAGILSQDGVNSLLIEWVFDSIIAPGQATLFSLLALFMAAASYRFLRIGQRGGAWILLGGLLMLVVQTPMASHFFLTPLLSVITIWIVEQPIMAALRGVLMGSSLAILIVGFRFILNQNR